MVAFIVLIGIIFGGIIIFTILIYVIGNNDDGFN